MTIPRIIHQIWFKFGDGPSSPPASFDEMRSSWRNLHPDWTIMEWDLPASRLFLQQHYSSYLPMFDSYKRDIFRVDAIRYFLLHHYGGFYIDTDVSALSSLEPLLRHKNVLCLNAYTKKVIHNNHVMGCEKGSHFFNECIKSLPAASLLQSGKDSFMAVMMTAGPLYLTGIAMTYRKRKDIYTLPHATERTFLIHHETHSWKLARNILGDVGRVALVVGGVVGGVYLIKKVSES